ncbi:MAG TPA: GNAT family protein, partial [Steroidobacteraceae bacterium]|nr:GNAT family protein [Steroidobacteraceae bacterium]
MRLEATPLWRDASVELFPLGVEHATNHYVAWLNDPQVNRFLESRFSTATPESVREFVAGAAASANVLFLGIRALEPRRHVGNIKLGPIDTRHGLGEIGIMIGDRMAWGRGVASAAIERLAAIARDQLRLRKLTAGCYASNAGSQRAFEKAGFRVEARRAAHFLLDGKTEDLVLMARLLDSDT